MNVWKWLIEGKGGGERAEEGEGKVEELTSNSVWDYTT